MILVTGATGCVGRVVVDRLVSSGHQVKCLWHWNHEHAAPRRVTITGGDVRNTASIVEALSDGGTCDTVIHLGSLRHETRNDTFADVNEQGTRNVVEACKQTNTPRLITVMPLGGETRSAFPMLRSMGKAEESVKASGINWTVLKSAAVVGEGDWLTSWIMGMSKGLPFVLPLPHDGRTKLQPIWVGDLAACVERCLSTRSTFRQIVPVGGPQSLTLAEIAQATMNASKRKRRVVKVSSRFTEQLSRFVTRCQHALDLSELESLSYNRTTEIGGVHRTFGFVPAKITTRLSFLSGAGDSFLTPVRY